MEKRNVKVSVIVPLYNQERYIKPCLRSICNQTYQNLEIIVVNDGSVDKSPQIVKQMAKNDHRIKVIDKKNEGTTFARRDGYLNSTGSFLTFVDNDDTLPKDAIELMVQDIENKHVDMVFGSITRKLGFIRKKQTYGTFPIGEVVTSPRLFEEYYLGFFLNTVFPISIWGRLFRKSVIDKAYSETELFSAEMPCMAGDEYFNLKLFPYLKSVYRTDAVVYNYRYGGTVNHFNRFFPEVFILTEKRLELLDDFGYEKGYLPLFNEYVACFYSQAEQLIEYHQTDKNGVKKYFKEELDNRSFVPRMMRFYEENSNKNEAVKMIKERDYEEMYDHAYDIMVKKTHTIRYRLKKNLNKAICWFNDIF